MESNITVIPARRHVGNTVKSRRNIPNSELQRIAVSAQTQTSRRPVMMLRFDITQSLFNSILIGILQVFLPMMEFQVLM